MTQRRLMNKKAFEEMELLDTRCNEQNAKGEDTFRPVLELADEGHEVYTILIFDKNAVLKNILSGKNYTEVEKKFTRFVSGK